MKRLGLSLLCGALLACGPAVPTWKHDVEPLVQGRCVSCHYEGGIAPFALTTYAQAKPLAASIAADVKSRKMPPWHAGEAGLPLLHDPQLTQAQIDTIAAWANGGAPEGDGPDAPPLPGVSAPLERVDLELAMPQPYTPALVPDEYRCFVIPWPEAQPKYVTGFNALAGSPKEVHHLAVYAVPAAQADLPRQWDAEEPGEGYTCFGGPFGSHPQTFPVNLLTAWIPGTQGTTYPRPFGIKVEPGTVLVLQLHYNNATQAPTQDLTKLQFQLADSVQKVAAYQPFLDQSWPLGTMNIPAGNDHVVIQYAADPRSFFKVLGSPLDLSRGFDIQAVMFHMHNLGVSGGLWLKKPDRTVQILDVPKWDFHWQLEYFLEEPVRFEPGDQLIVRCVYDNSPRMWPAGQTPRDVNWGEGSADEMCVANLLSSE